VSACFCCVVLCFSRGLALDWSPNQGVLPNVCGSRSLLRKAKVRKDCRSQLKKKTIIKCFLGLSLREAQCMISDRLSDSSCEDMDTVWINASGRTHSLYNDATDLRYAAFLLGLIISTEQDQRPSMCQCCHLP
jgi:hypothetical protein